MIELKITADNADDLFATLHRLAGKNAPAASPKAEPVKQDTTPVSEPSANTENSEQVGNGSTATTAASPSDGEVDAHGHPWNEELHASTKGTTKDGLWRMKIGVARPAPMPGFPIAATTSTTTTGAESQPAATAPTEAASEEAPLKTDAPQTDVEDEFAAFRDAAAKVDAVDDAAKASVPARKWTDADLGALCNQAATKLGDPAPVKAIITEYTPEGEVAHSRNIPEESREAFVKAVEAKAGIEFAG